MLLTAINQDLLANPTTASYASLITTYPEIEQEIQRLETALRALHEKDSESLLYRTAFELLQHGKQLRERYNSIRGHEDNTFRDLLFFRHAYRISLTFARLNVEQTLSLFKFEHMARVLDAPIQTLYFFSFALLSMRLLLNVLKAAKHALFPTELEKIGLDSSYKRFLYDLSLIAIQMLNDAIWATANLLTNYPQLLGLSNPVTNAILFVCLAFDLVLSVYMYHQNENTYIQKRDEYKHALAHMQPDDIMLEVLSMQLKQLELNYQGDRAKLEQFLAAGAVILLAFSFIASSLCPFFLPLGAALCVFGTSLYLTAGKRGECIKHPSDENNHAYYEALIKNTLYPLCFMIAAASLGWPLAILVAAPIMIYENRASIANLLEPEKTAALT